MATWRRLPICCRAGSKWRRTVRSITPMTDLAPPNGATDGVQKIAPNGIVSNVAGTGVTGFTGDGGPATSAQFSFVGGVAVDPAGIIYISDTGNHRIRKVGLDGIIKTFAGNGVAGNTGDGGPAL